MNKPRHESRATSLKFIKKRGWIIALVITAFGFLLRVAGISEWWLNPDEGICFSMLTWADSTKFWTEMAHNAHPPLYYLVIRALGAVTTDFVVIRSLSLLFGSLAIYAAWLVGKEIVASDQSASMTGLLSALFVAASPNAITMSQLMRPYMMQLAMLLMALYMLLRYRNTRQNSCLVWYSVFLSLSLLTHYSSFLALGVLGILILSDFAVGRCGLREVIPFLAAHGAPVLICIGLYLLHLRPRLVGSALATEALEGWLAPLMVHSIWDVGARLYGFMGYMLGAHFAGPAALIWIAGLAVAFRKRSWTMLIINVAAVGVATLVATMGQYPFGACRHATWIVAFLIYPVAWMLAQAVTSNHRAKTTAVSMIVTLVIAGVIFDRTVGRKRTSTSPLKEHVLKRSGMAAIRPVLSPGGIPNTMLMSAQSYYLLLPLYVDERQTAEPSHDGSFFHFQWASREVIVVQSWNFTVRPDDIEEPNHLYTFVLNVDRQMPRLQLGKQNEVLIVFGGWSHETPKRLLLADQSLPPGVGLISKKNEAPGLTVFNFDIARYRLMMREALNRETR